MRRLWAGAGITAVTVAAAFAAAAPASAAQQSQSLTCTDLGPITVSTPTQNSSDHGGWSVGQITAGPTGHLIPTSFTFSATDDQTGVTVFSGSQIKGQGHANTNQPSVTCTQQSPAGTVGDLFPPDMQPAGTSPSDTVTFTITVTAVPKV